MKAPLCEITKIIQRTVVIIRYSITADLFLYTSVATQQILVHYSYVPGSKLLSFLHCVIMMPCNNTVRQNNKWRATCSVLNVMRYTWIDRFSEFIVFPYMSNRFWKWWLKNVLRCEACTSVCRCTICVCGV